MHAAIMLPKGQAGSGLTLRTGKGFRPGAAPRRGAYICGEETSLLDSLEGKRALVRAKPPLPAMSGLFGKPTLINNVLIFAAIPYILDKGAQPMPIMAWAVRWARCPSSSAAMFCAAAWLNWPSASACAKSSKTWRRDRRGRPVRAVQLGGPLGAYLAGRDLDVPLDYEALAARGSYFLD